MFSTILGCKTPPHQMYFIACGNKTNAAEYIELLTTSFSHSRLLIKFWCKAEEARKINLKQILTFSSSFYCKTQSWHMIYDWLMLLDQNKFDTITDKSGQNMTNSSKFDQTSSFSKFAMLQLLVFSKTMKISNLNQKCQMGCCVQLVSI